MAFDDALQAARRSADERTAAARKQAEEDALREQGLQQKAERLVRDALPHLLPHGQDVVIAAVKAAQGPWRDKSGFTYRETGRGRCWVFRQEGARPGLRTEAEFMDCPLVVLEDGTAWRLWCNLRASYTEGQFVTSIQPQPLSREAVTHRKDGRGDWTAQLQNDLAAAVVRYERGERLPPVGHFLNLPEPGHGRRALGGRP
ncbi:hypothetical protein OK006_8975 [Actinobacteria bacterium OK006]|nr:hypothetical protein OK006_8975 [Actinobacteria bacterium OK006]